MCLYMKVFHVLQIERQLIESDKFLSETNLHDEGVEEDIMRKVNDITLK